METKKKPVHSGGLGKVRYAIWSNEGKQGRWFNVTFERRYRDSEGNWQSASSFDRDDLLVLAKVADMAHTKLYELQAAERAGAAGTDAEGA